MDFETLKEQVLERFGFYKSQVVESELYIRAKEGYDTLNPNVQTLVKVGVIGFVVYFFYSIPASFVSSSSEKMSFFEENRELTRDLIRAGRISKNLQLPPPAPSPTQLTQRIEGFLTEEQVLEEQKQAITPKADIADKSLVPPTIQQNGVKASVKKLTLTQMVRLGEAMNRIDGGKLFNMIIQADNDDPHFFTVDYEVAAFSVPIAPAPATSGPKAKGGKSKFKSRFKKKDK